MANKALTVWERIETVKGVDGTETEIRTLFRKRQDAERCIVDRRGPTVEGAEKSFTYGYDWNGNFIYVHSVQAF